MIVLPPGIIFIPVKTDPFQSIDIGQIGRGELDFVSLDCAGTGCGPPVVTACVDV